MSAFLSRLFLSRQRRAKPNSNLIKLGATWRRPSDWTTTRYRHHMVISELWNCQNFWTRAARPRRPREQRRRCSALMTVIFPSGQSQKLHGVCSRARRAEPTPGCGCCRWTWLAICDLTKGWFPEQRIVQLTLSKERSKPRKSQSVIKTRYRQQQQPFVVTPHGVIYEVRRPAIAGQQMGPPAALNTCSH